MRRLVVSRRAALLGGGAGLLGGCEAISSIFGERERPLPGERRPVLAVERPLGLDEAGSGGGPVNLPPIVENAEWAQAGGTISHAPGHPALGRGLAELWRSSVGTGSGYRRRLTAPPLVAGGTVYAMDAYGLVTALDAANGRRRWQTDLRPRRDRDGALGGGIAVEGGRLYAVTGLAEAMAIDPADGSIGWRVPLSAPARGSPTVAGGRILVPTVENHLLALSVEDGRRLWTYRAQPTTTMSLGLPAPAVEGELVLAGFGSGELAAIRAADGRLAWSESLSSARGGGLADIAAIAAMPVIDRGRVFATGLGGLTVALDLRSGRRLWEREVASVETPWSAGDALFLLAASGNLACLGREDGRVRWLTPLGRFENEKRRRDPIFWGPPVLAGGRLLVPGSHGRMAEVNPLNGELMGTVRLRDGVVLQPAVAGGVLFLLNEGAEVVAMRGQDRTAA
ncbi:MAG TPA: PQQ-binding-like beta-propeller repeat protein [Acetobacteraceae bacterium]|nr:PQQ-binding-like beta-propeller repeat protein [Acetobacteraceae bacterium]